MTVRTVLVCEAQVPFVHGGAEVHVRELVRELRQRGLRGGARQRAVQVVSEGRNPAARGGVAAARSQREQRPADRSRHRVEVPDLLRAASAQGRVADPPVPRRLRAVRHAVQRLRAHRARRRPARHADPARHGDARRVPRACSRTRGTRPTRLAKFNGLAAEPLYHPPRLAARLARRPVRRLRAVGRPDRVGQARRPASSRRWPGATRRSGSSSRATGRSAQNVERWPRRRRASRTASTFLGDVGDERAASTSTPARSRWSIRRSTRTSATSRSRRSCRGSRSITVHRLRRPERVRRRRRQRLRLRARARRRSAAAIDRLGRDRARAAAMGDAGYERRAAASRGTA